jgi:hypothetical protein
MFTHSACASAAAARARRLLVPGLLLACCLGMTGMVGAEENPAAPVEGESGGQAAGPESRDNPIDSLFNDPGDSTVGDGQGDGDKVDITSLTTSEKPVVKGSVNLKGTYSMGWSQVPDLSNLGLGFDKNVGYALILRGNFDARPDQTLHVYGSFSASFPGGVDTTTKNTNPLGEIYSVIGGTTTSNISLAWTVAIQEVYVDYTLLNTVFFRIGKADFTWGKGQIIGNPGNFLAGCVDGVSLKAAVPLLGGTWSTVVLTRPSYFDEALKITPTDLGIATNWEGSIGPVNLGLAFFGQKKQENGYKASLYLKGSLWGIDLYEESVMDFRGLVYKTGWVTTNFSTADVSTVPVYQQVAGFFWEGGEPKFQVQGEWLYNGATKTGGFDNTIALGAAIKAIPGTSMKVGLQWVHTFWDNSGNLTLGLSTPIADHLSLSVALPYIYGETGSRYVPNKTTQRIGMVVGLELSGDY